VIVEDTSEGLEIVNKIYKDLEKLKEIKRD
jgi:hypothetical protein